jgi:hypothetical protein
MHLRPSNNNSNATKDHDNSEFLKDFSICFKYINSLIQKLVNLNENYDIESLIDEKGYFFMLILFN